MDRPGFEKEKKSSLGHLLIKVGRLYHEQSVERVRKAAGWKRLTPAHLDLFAHIDFEGTTVVEVARRKGVSKQAVSRLVREMVEMGMLVKKKNEQDQRSHLVTFQTKGKGSIFKGFELLKNLDLDLIEALGEKDYQTTLRSLVKIQESLESSRGKA